MQFLMHNLVQQMVSEHTVGELVEGLNGMQPWFVMYRVARWREGEREREREREREGERYIDRE